MSRNFICQRLEKQLFLYLSTEKGFVSCFLSLIPVPTRFGMAADPSYNSKVSDFAELGMRLKNLFFLQIALLITVTLKRHIGHIHL